MGGCVEKHGCNSVIDEFFFKYLSFGFLFEQSIWKWEKNKCMVWCENFELKLELHIISKVVINKISFILNSSENYI
jgi:hypothetical protein